MERIGGRRKNNGKETTNRRILETLEGVRSAKKCLSTGRIKSREESIFKKEDVDRMFSEPVGESLYGSPLPFLPLSIGTRSPQSIAERRRVVLIYGNRPADLRISNSRLRGSVPMRPRVDRMCAHYMDGFTG